MIGLADCRKLISMSCGERIGADSYFMIEEGSVHDRPLAALSQDGDVLDGTALGQDHAVRWVVGNDARLRQTLALSNN